MRDDAAVRPRWTPLCRLVTALLLGAAAAGCGAPKVSLAVRPDDALNERRPTYLLVRNVDAKTYREEAYETAAAKVMSPDDSVLQTAVIFPDTPQDLRVTLPEKGQIAVYVFFYRPRGDWKVLLPSSAACYEVVLEGSRLRIEQR